MKLKFLCSTLLLALFMASTGYAYNVTVKTSAGVGIPNVSVSYNNNGGGAWLNVLTDASGGATIPGGQNFVDLRNYNLGTTGWVNTGGADITFYTTAVTAVVKSCVTGNVIPGASFRFNPGSTEGGTWLTGSTQELLAGTWYVAADISGNVRNAQTPTLPANNTTAGLTWTVTFLTTKVTGGAGSVYCDPLHDGLNNYYRLRPFTPAAGIEVLPGTYYFKINSTSSSYLNGIIIGPYAISGCSASFNTYTVTFNSNGGSAVSSITGVVYNTAVGPLPADPTRTGYTFGGWFTDNGTFLVPFTASSIITADITVYAKWTAVSQTLTFDSNGGTAVTAITQNFGTTVNAPSDPTKSGYTFAGWYSDAGLTTAYTFPHTMGLSTTIYAKWTAVSQTLTFDSNGGTAVAAITQDFGTTVNAPSDPTKSGYTFAGWYSDAGLTTAYTFPHAMGLSTTIYAKWTAVSQTLTFDSNGGTAVTAITQNFGMTVNAPSDPTKPGYTFAGWYSDAGLTTAYTFPHAMGLSTTIYAKWTAVKQTLTYDSNGGTAVEPIIQDIGTTVNAPSDPTKTGYTFAGWNSDAGLTTSNI